MNDLIHRQAAIDAVYKCTDIFINNLPVMVDKADAYKALAELPSAQPEPQWIPCSEKLPEEYGEYRITWTTSASKSRFIGDSEYEITGEWDSENYRFKGEWLLPDYIKAYPSVKVLAWRELEEPWRGEEHEND